MANKIRGLEGYVCVCVYVRTFSGIGKKTEGVEVLTFINILKDMLFNLCIWVAQCTSSDTECCVLLIKLWMESLA